MEKKTKKVKKCLTETVEHDKLEKSPREADKKSYKKDKKTFDRKSRMWQDKEVAKRREKFFEN
ncbi:hypothetical protein [Turicibacter sp. TS3]|uniref:hypothetical protein n=1 Tax=Turicibacter sp. TS3 TaxID=2304578 RepID=UPI00137A9651|nr:hypothetical protein [Turicibacter sp. TS3]NCE79145.1 hypothetical protein [Turicibacter sp. TS3]